MRRRSRIAIKRCNEQSRKPTPVMPTDPMQPYFDKLCTEHSSANEETDGTFDGDDDIMYSFDRERGPGRGSEILSLAINKAVQRYEDTVTDKLVKDEWDVVSGDEEEKKVKEDVDRDGGYVADEDEYEFV